MGLSEAAASFFPSFFSCFRARRSLSSRSRVILPIVCRFFVGLIRPCLSLDSSTHRTGSPGPRCRLVDARNRLARGIPGVSRRTVWLAKLLDRRLDPVGERLCVGKVRLRLLDLDRLADKHDHPGEPDLELAGSQR